MQLARSLHCLRLEFNVTPEIRRFVNVGVFEREHVYLVDTGVAPSYDELTSYLSEQGCDYEHVNGILLTHSHPDHIGNAAQIKNLSNCKVWASQAERDWIENIDAQFAVRPIPNFHTLAGSSVQVDTGCKDGDVIELEKGFNVEVLATPGHSQGSVCYFLRERRVLFTGDAIPVPGDVPIYEDMGQSIASLEKLLDLTGVDYYIPSWDGPCEADEGLERIRLALEWMRAIDAVVTEQIGKDPNPATLTDRVCEASDLQDFKSNPLFARSILSHLRK